MRAIPTLLAMCAAAIAVPAMAQLGLPGISLPALEVPGAPIQRPLAGAGETLAQAAERLLQVRTARLERLLRRNRELIEPDLQGAPSRRGELLVLDPDPASLAAARARGFQPIGRESMGSLGLSVVRLAVPPGRSLAEGEALLRRILPGADIAADTLHFQSGASPALAAAMAAGARPHPDSGAKFGASPIATPVGVIDGAPGRGQRVQAVRGFAQGGPRASDHGSAVVSLLQGAGARDLRVADIYGTDRAGGNALALIRALDWLTGGGARIISISLQGPANAAVAKAVAAAQRKGVVVVAAVGNDGPAAPPAYPASYRGVLAVTATDSAGRPLIEAGRALHLDYAAPGADILARNGDGKWSRVRGTSYAVPLVAARAAAAIARGGPLREALDREAEDLGRRGPDDRYGRGLLCRTCARSS